MNRQRLKAVVLSLLIAIGLALPSPLYSQFAKSDGFFNESASQGYTNRDVPSVNWENANLNNQTFGQEVHLADGLLVLMAIGMLYAIMKREKTMNPTKQ